MENNGFITRTPHSKHFIDLHAERTLPLAPFSGFKVAFSAGCGLSALLVPFSAFVTYKLSPCVYFIRVFTFVSLI
jgi:hypothetical protein